MADLNIKAVNNHNSTVHTKHHGLALLPPPSTDENDPLRWPRSFKLAALAATAFVNFTTNFAGAGLSVAIPVLEQEFHKTPNQVNALLTFNFLLLGVGNLFWVPLGVKFGKRASLLVSTFLLFAVLIWTAKASDFNTLLAARCLSGFASAAGESIVPSIVSDLFFLHERAAMMSAYTILVSSATAVGPLIASFIVQYSRNTWVNYVWVCVALAGVNLLAIYLLYPESNFDRPEVDQNALALANMTTIGTKQVTEDRVERCAINGVVAKSWRSVWLSFATVNHSVSLFRVSCRPLLMLFKPPVLFAVFVYGTSLAAQIIVIFALPNLLMAPPYLFPATGVGLMQIAAIIGFVAACVAGGYLADVITAQVIRRQGGRVFPAQRLIALLPGCFVAPAGCIITAFASANKMHWISIAIGFGMLSFGTVYAPNIAITFVVELYPKLAGESLVFINVFKNLVAFLFLYTAVDWIASQGWIQVYMIMFMLVTLSMLLAIPFYIHGARGKSRC